MTLMNTFSIAIVVELMRVRNTRIVAIVATVDLNLLLETYSKNDKE